MPTQRKSFIIHKDSLSVLDELSDEQAGLLFKAMKDYQNDEEIELDSLTKIIFSPFKAQFDRDNEKYKKIVERNKNNGLKGGRPKTEANPENPSKPSGLIRNPENPSEADSVSKSKNDSKSDSEVTKDIDPLLTKETVNQNLDLLEPEAVSKVKVNYATEDINFAHWFYERLLLINPKQKKPTKAIFEKWANTIRLIRAGDGKSHQEMSDLFMWVNNSEFWKGNIQSPMKFRKQWDMLTDQMNKDAGKHDINAIGTDFSAPDDWNNKDFTS
jgi:hypothetical protein